MRKRTLVIFIAYIWSKTLLGLTFQPYTSLREVIRRPVLFPVIFSPLIGLCLLFIIGRIGAMLLTISGISREFVAIILSTIFLSIAFWQLLLLYLLGNFLLAFWRGK